MTSTPDSGSEPVSGERFGKGPEVSWSQQVTDLEGTERLGQWWGRNAERGLTLELRGTLGAGKTTFTRQLGEALGVVETISSPTFVICRRHDGRLPLFHIDAYRLEDPTELILQGWDEMLVEGVVVVEWGERVAELLPEDRVVIHIEHRGEFAREFQLQGWGVRAAALVERSKEALDKGH